jgi:capsular polysaccharide biosynthesis protein
VSQRYPERKVSIFRGADLSIRQQIRILSQTEVLVAPHGAGLTNMLFLPSYGKIVEIHNSPTFLHFEYFDIANALRLCYRGIGPKQINATHVDFNTVDVDILLTTLEEVLQCEIPSAEFTHMTPATVKTP